MYIYKKNTKNTKNTTIFVRCSIDCLFDASEYTTKNEKYTNQLKVQPITKLVKLKLKIKAKASRFLVLNSK